MSLLQRAIEDSIATMRSLASLEAPLERAAAMVSKCLTSGHKLLLCGNGGRQDEGAERGEKETAKPHGVKLRAKTDSASHRAAAWQN